VAAKTTFMKTSDLAIPFSGSFFQSYLVDHFLYKQESLLCFLRYYDELKGKLEEGISEINDEQYRQTLKVEIRSTYFQAIETLFELIFSLEPRDGVVDNRNIWFFLSTSKWHDNYDRIQDIANGELAFLDRQINANPNLIIPFVQYLFFFGVTNESKLKDVQDSIDPIRKLLRAFASEFTNRDEYNAIKHSIRLIQLMQEYKIVQKGTDKTLFKRDFKDSVSYLKHETDGSLTAYTKPLDTIRDFKMTTVCSNLISNIFRSRRYHFTKDDSIVIHTFTEESFTDATKRNVDWTQLKLNIKFSNES